MSRLQGDGSFSWSGAAGMGSQNGQVPMRKDTPVYIASITKLYTATAIMRLHEKGQLSLNDSSALIVRLMAFKKVIDIF